MPGYFLFILISFQVKEANDSDIATDVLTEEEAIVFPATYTLVVNTPQNEAKEIYWQTFSIRMPPYKTVKLEASQPGKLKLLPKCNLQVKAILDVEFNPKFVEFNGEFHSLGNPLTITSLILMSITSLILTMIGTLP